MLRYLKEGPPPLPGGENNQIVKIVDKLFKNLIQNHLDNFKINLTISIHGCIEFFMGKEMRHTENTKYINHY